ncbi:hypothetical protein EIP86_007028 [Pleurotus ostreatoroseus]|nr:hypothetical protein EIP86_007028 [Pleurotus ostreatoroseus]
MPHFFPSLRRSKDHGRANQYSRYDEDPHYESRQSQSSAWRRVVPSRGDGNWQEEFVEYPESYPGADDYYGSRPRTNRPIRRDYARQRVYDTQSESTATATDEVMGESRFYSRDNAVPIVQRESSLTRLQEVFSEQAASSGPRPVTEVTLPQGTPRPTPIDMQPPPRPPVAAEMRNAYPTQQPILVQNSTANSMEADIRIQRSQSYAPRPRRTSSRHAADIQPSASMRSREEEEYPPCVVVVERGRNGKPDTYYVIPGGAPVVFEDQQGNELTRVGDFSGRYRPRKQRPVIIEDEHGREVGRLGFDDEGSLDYQYRRAAEDTRYDRNGEYDSGYRSRFEGRQPSLWAVGQE